VPAVRKATTIGDVVMYVVLTAILVTGAWNTLTTTFDHHYNYRQGVSPWFRSIFTFQPDIELMVNSPFSFQAHAFLAFLILLIWPFTRLVHAFSIPVGYVTRPYVVYRSAGKKPVRNTNVPPGLWDKPKLKEQV
jgi:putative nitrate reductase gamma subunit